jgi:predicted Zn-dependent protease
MKKSIILFFVLAFAVTFSCTSEGASLTGALAKKAGDVGMIDSTVADALARSSDAFAQAKEDITPSEEYYIGRAVGANILSTYKLYTAEPNLTLYANKVLNTLAINSPKPSAYNGYHVGILDSDEINAFSTSGGHIFVTRGLLACAASEDALASVLAHELAHVQLQHSIESIKSSRFTGALQQVAGIAADAAGLSELTKAFDEGIKEAVNTMINNGYSQTQEFEADSTALSLLASAGYTPSSIFDMLDTLKANSQGKTGGFSKTHPSPQSRIDSAKKSIGKYAAADAQGKETQMYRKPRFDASKKK